MKKKIDIKKLKIKAKKGNLKAIKELGYIYYFGDVKEGKDDNHVKELFMLISGLKELTKDSPIEINGEMREFETVVVSITGDIDLREISKITSAMNVPGGKNLEKVGKKN